VFAENRAHQMQLVERDAEMLAVLHLDLLAQVEQQLRAVHHTMRHIETLRQTKNRVGPELSNGQRETTLTHLGEEVEALDAQLNTEHACCTEMRDIIATMQAHVRELRRRVAFTERASNDASEPGVEF
jgi:predicted  nucleic acid-binding Zn-ribbon protein